MAQRSQGSFPAIEASDNTNYNIFVSLCEYNNVEVEALIEFILVPK